MKGKVAPTKSTTKAYVSFCLSLSAVVSPALYRIFLSTVKQLRNGKRAACNHGVMDARGRLLSTKEA